MHVWGLADYGTHGNLRVVDGNRRLWALKFDEVDA
jgi:hypothetical protein